MNKDGWCLCCGCNHLTCITKTLVVMKKGWVVWVKSSHLSLVRSDKDISCDEESTIFCRRHNIVSFIPDPVLFKESIVNKLV